MEADAQVYLCLNNRQAGPFTAARLVEMRTEQQISGNDWVAVPGGKWTRYKEMFPLEEEMSSLDHRMRCYCNPASPFALPEPMKGALKEAIVKASTGYQADLGGVASVCDHLIAADEFTKGVVQFVRTAKIMQFMKRIFWGWVIGAAVLCLWVPTSVSVKRREQAAQVHAGGMRLLWEQSEWDAQALKQMPYENSYATQVAVHIAYGQIVLHQIVLFLAALVCLYLFWPRVPIPNWLL